MPALLKSIFWGLRDPANVQKGESYMAVRLTQVEQEMLEGKFGKAKQIALQGIICYAEILGATELVEVRKGHRCCGCTAVPADFPVGI